MKYRLVWTFRLLLALAICAIVGCGGGSGVNGTTLLQGDAAHRAAIIAGYQSFTAGVAYPYNTLKMIAPTGSAIQSGAGKAALPATSILGIVASLPRHSGATRATNLSYIPALNLYSSGTPSVSSNIWTLTFFTDAAGTTSAGNIVITLPTGSNGNTDYLSYPAQINIAVNLTAGNLPCNGNVVVIFTDGAGKNTMTGTLNLPNGPITYTLNLALDDSLNVSGTIVGHEHGATITLSNCSDNLFGTLNCDLSIDPYGWKGTATGSFVTGQFSTSVTTTTGKCTAAIDSSGALQISYPDSKTETVTNPITASLVSSGSSSGSSGNSGSGGSGSSGSGGAGGTTTPTYNAPLNLGAITPVQINNSGQIIGITTDASQVPVFMQSSTSAMQKLPGVTQPFQSPIYSALSINNSGQIAGFGGNLGGVLWQTATSQPQTLTGSSSNANAINDAGVIIGQTYDASGTPITTAWTDPKTPHTMTSLGIYDTPLGISSDGQIVGWTYHSNAITVSYWKNYSATPTALALGAITFGSSTMTSMSINTSGQICGTQSNGGALYWASPTATAQYLPGYDTSTASNDKASAINASGVVAGSAFSSGFFPQNYHAVIWKNLQVQDLNSLIPSGTGWILTNATSINDQGVIVGTGQITVNGKLQTTAFLLTPKQ